MDRNTTFHTIKIVRWIITVFLAFAYTSCQSSNSPKTFEPALSLEKQSIITRQPQSSPSPSATLTHTPGSENRISTIQPVRTRALPVPENIISTEELPTATQIPTTPTPVKTPAPQVIIKPQVTAPGLGIGFRLDGWSLDSEWVAYWVGERNEGIPAHLAFYNVINHQGCQIEEVNAGDLWSGQVIWNEDGSVIVLLHPDEKALVGRPCDAFTTIEDYVSPRKSGLLSPDIRYRADTTILGWEDQAIQIATTITDLETDRVIVSAAYIGSPHLRDAGDKWLTDQLYLIGKTVDQGVLYISLPEGKVGHVYPDILGLDANKEYDVQKVDSFADPDSGAYHLLIERWDGTPRNSSLLLFHSELDRVETLAFYNAWPFNQGSSFSPDGAWILIGNPVDGGETGGSDYRLRPVDPVDSIPKRIVGGGSFFAFSNEAQKMIFVSLKGIFIFSFPDGELLAQFSSDEYSLQPFGWSPVGSHVAAYGAPMDQSQYEAIFIITP
jgi:hypothetical protein